MYAKVYFKIVVSDCINSIPQYTGIPAAGIKKYFVVHRPAAVTTEAPVRSVKGLIREEGIHKESALSACVPGVLGVLAAVFAPVLFIIKGV